MITPTQSFFELPVEAKRRVDAVCQSFERAGRGSRIEDYLTLVDAEVRPALLSELLAIELEWRRSAGESPAVGEYLERFPNTAFAVRAAFGPITPAVGGTLGKYRLIGELGRGGMGVVFEALDPMIDRKVAIKVLPDRLATDPLAHTRLIHEARLAGQILHPNVVALFELGEADGVAFLVLERVTGGTAAELLQREGPLDWLRATRMMLDVCRGLTAIHAANFLHLDIKPGNILLPGSDGGIGSVVAKLSDFSLSSAEQPVGGVTAGTPAYMSPEQRATGALTTRTDIFGIGATFYALLTGRAPFAGSTVTEILADQLRQPVPDPRAVNDAIPENVAVVVRRAMAHRPEDRFASAAELMHELERLLIPQKPRRWREVVAGGLALFLLVGLVLLLAPPREDGSTRISPVPFERVNVWEPLLDGQDMTEWKPVVPDGVTPIGVGPASVFGMIEMEGGPALRASGTGLGAVESVREFEDFHLRFEYRWATANGDHLASIRYHCSGDYGSKGTHGMMLHLQRAGSYIRLNDFLRIDVGEIRDGKVVPVSPGGREIPPQQGKEAPVGRWNKAALVCFQDASLHVVNGAPVLTLAKSRRVDPPDQPLTRGRIRFHSIKGEVYFRKIEIRRITELPAEFLTPDATP